MNRDKKAEIGLRDKADIITAGESSEGYRSVKPG